MSNNNDILIFCCCVFIFMFGYLFICCTPNGPKIITIEPNQPSLAGAESIIPFSVPKRRSLGLFLVTAYCPCEKCCGDYADGVTASGRPAEGKLIAADPVFPFGLLLDVPGYGERIPVEDRGGAIKNRHIDLLFPNHEEALVWGKQYLEIHGWFYLEVK